MWRTSTFMQIGRGHLKAGTPCQDRSYALAKDGVQIIVLADGAGSAAYSQYGAELVAKETAGYLAEHFESVVRGIKKGTEKRRLLVMLQEKLREEGCRRACSYSELASTLLFVAVKGNLAVIGHLGDGVIGTVKDGKAMVLSHPENGEFANSTYFVTSPEAERRMKLFTMKLRRTAGFILMSDGCAETFYHRVKRKLSDYAVSLVLWNAMLTEAALQETLEQNFQEIIKRTKDDCSMALLSRADANQLKRLYRSDDLKELFGIANTEKKGDKRLKNYIRVLKKAKNGKPVGKFTKRRWWLFGRRQSRKYITELVELDILCPVPQTTHQ